MTHKVYIEALNNFPIADWGVSAYMGFKSKEHLPTSLRILRKYQYLLIIL